MRVRRPSCEGDVNMEKWSGRIKVKKKKSKLTNKIAGKIIKWNIFHYLFFLPGCAVSHAR